MWDFFDLDFLDFFFFRFLLSSSESLLSEFDEDDEEVDVVDDELGDLLTQRQFKIKKNNLKICNH